MNINLDQFRFLHPFWINSAMALAVISSRENQASMDHELWYKAKSLEIPCDGIESVEDQQLIFQQITTASQLDQFKSAVRNVRRFRRQNQSLLKLYGKGDIYKLYQKSKKSIGAQKGFMLYDRNIAMANRIFEVISHQSSFVSIGAAHLCGSQGVLTLLKKKAIKLEPVRS